MSRTPTQRSPVLADCIHVERRYRRSVNILRDFPDPHALDGYRLTPGVRQILERLSLGLAAESTHRAWRITGPYGVGKSAFGLFLARLLKQDPQALSLVAGAANNSTPIALPTRTPVIVAAQRAPLEPSIVRALLDQVPSLPHDLYADLQAALPGGETQRLLSLLARVGRHVRAAGTSEGLLLILDEAGKFLEYAALHPRDADPFTLQGLAEQAGGTAHPELAVVLLMHHRFGDYASAFGGRMEAEWSRIGERFEDLPFQDGIGPTVHLIADALTHEDRCRALLDAPAVDQLLAKAAAVPGLTASIAIGSRLFPLHPTLLPVLYAATHRFGQDQRSVFNFLASPEVNGLQDFLVRTELRPDAWYRIADLFSWLAAQDSLRIRDGDRQRRWEHLTHLQATQVLTKSERDLLATAGLLAVLEPHPGLIADEGLLALAIEDAAEPSATLRAAFAGLVERGLLYRRERNGDYALWPHTSVDLERWYRQSLPQVPRPERLDQEFGELPPPRPLVAHRHYQRTGTLRAFRLRLAEPGATTGASPAALPDRAAAGYDGELVMVPLYRDQSIDDTAREIAAAEWGKDSRRLIYLHVVAGDAIALAHERRRWQWVLATCLELRADAAARAEVQRCIDQTGSALLGLLSRFYRPGNGPNGVWIYQGQPITIPEGPSLSSTLSDICDRVYDQAPVVRNELINRERPTAAAATARQRLIQRLFAHEDAPELGMSGGFPAERAIYISVFATSGLHRKRGDAWAVRPPTADHNDPNRWLPVWAHVFALLKDGGQHRVSDLVAGLAEPPFGVRAGLTLILLAAMLLAHRQRLLLFERDSYVIEPDANVFMRLAKAPERFALADALSGDAGEAWLVAYNQGLSLLSEDPAGTLPGLADRLYTWYLGLPPYARATRHVSLLAQRVRTAMEKAEDPAALLLRTLPKVAGIAEAKSKDPGQFEPLDTALRELADAAADLRAKVAAALCGAWCLGDDPNALRTNLAKRFSPHAERLTEYRDRGLLNRASDPKTEDEDWVDSVANLLTGRTLDNWKDDDLQTFCNVALAQAGRLKRLVALLADHGQGNGLCAVHLTLGTGEEYSTGALALKGETGENADLLADLRPRLGEPQRAVEILVQLLEENLKQLKLLEDVDGKNL